MQEDRSNFVQDPPAGSGRLRAYLRLAGYAIKTAEGYTITTSATVRMTATSNWVWRPLNVTSMATWAALRARVRFGISKWPIRLGIRGTYRVTATFSGNG
jgi:hypothetical protein